MKAGKEKERSREEHPGWQWNKKRKQREINSKLLGVVDRM